MEIVWIAGGGTARLPHADKDGEADATRQAGKLGAEKPTPEEQRRRIIEAVREAGASEDEADFNAALKQVAKPKMAKSRAY